ncbi:MAG: hypothetical protein WC506_02940 [Candidatus Micrarchaeia archaeon]
MAKSYLNQNDTRQPGAGTGQTKGNFFKRAFKTAKAVGKLAGPFFFLHAASVFPGQQAMPAALGDSTSAKGYKQVNAQIIDTGEKVKQMAQLLATAPTQDKAKLESIQANLNVIKGEMPKLEKALKNNKNADAKKSMDIIFQSRNAILKDLDSLATPDGKAMGAEIRSYIDSKALSYVLPGSTLARLVSEKKDLADYYNRAKFSDGTSKITVSQLLANRIAGDASDMISKSQAITSRMSDNLPQTDVISESTRQTVPTPGASTELLTSSEKTNLKKQAKDAMLQIVRLSYGLLTPSYSNVGDLIPVREQFSAQLTSYLSAKTQLGEQATMESDLLGQIKEYVGDNALYNSIAPIFTTGSGDMSQRVNANITSMVRAYVSLSQFDTNVKSMILGGMRVAPIIDGVASSISQSTSKSDIINSLNSLMDQMSVVQGANSSLLNGINSIISNVNGLQEIDAHAASNIAGQVSGLKSSVPATTEEANILQNLNALKSGITSNPMMDFVLARYYGENGEGLASISGTQKPGGTNLREFYFNTVFSKCSDKAFVDAVRSVYLSDKFSGDVADIVDSRTVFATESSLAASQLGLNTLAQRSVANFDVFSIYGLHQLFNSPRFSTMQPEDVRSIVDGMARMEPKSSYIAAMNPEAFDKIIGLAGTSQSFPLVLDMLSKQNMLFVHSGGWQAYDNSWGFYSDIKSAAFTGDLGTNIVSTHVTTSRRTIETLTPLDQIVPRYQYLPFFNPAQASLWLSQGQVLFNQQYSGREDQLGTYNQRAAVDASSFSLMNFLRPPAAPSVMSSAFSPEHLGYGMGANDISQQLNDLYLSRSMKNVSPRIIGGSVRGGLGFDFNEPLQGGVGFDVLQPGGSSTTGYARTLPTSSSTTNQAGQDITTSETSRTEMLLQGNRMNYWGQIVGDAFYNSISTETSNKQVVQDQSGVNQTGPESSYVKNFISSSDANLIFGKDANVRVIGSTIANSSGDLSQETSTKVATYDIWMREKATGSWVRVALDKDQQEQFDKTMNARVNDGLNHTLVEAATSFGGWKGARIPGMGVETLKQDVQSQSTDNRVAFYFGLYVPGIETATVTAATLTGNRVSAVSKKFGESTVFTAGYFAYNEKEAFDRIVSGASAQNYDFRRGWKPTYEGAPLIKGGELEMLVLDNWKASLFGGSSSGGTNTVAGGSFYNKSVSAGGYFSYEKAGDKTVLKQAVANAGTRFGVFGYDVTASGSLLKYASDRNLYSAMVSTKKNDASLTMFSSYQQGAQTKIDDTRIRAIRSNLSSNVERLSKPNIGNREREEALQSVWSNLSDFVIWDPQEEIRRGFNTMHGAIFNSPKFSAGLTSMRMHDGSDIIMPSLSIGENLSIVGGVTAKREETAGLRTPGDMKNFLNLKFANNEFGFMGELYQLDGMQYGKLSAGVRTGELSGLGGTFSMSSDSRLYKLDLMYAGESSSIMLNVSGMDDLRARGISVSKTLSESTDLALRFWHVSMVNGKGPDSYQFQTQMDFRTGETGKISVIGTFEKIKGIDKPNGELKLQYSWGLGR